MLQSGEKRILNGTLGLTVASLLLIVNTALAQSVPGPPTTTVVVDSKSKGRIFDGLGALSAGASSRLLYDYPEPQRSQILDYLFKPGYGAALQHLKVEVGADVNSTDGSEPSHMRTREDHDYTRGYEWWLMVEAHKRNPNIILDILPWGAPGWVGNGKLYSPDMAEYMADFIEGARKTYGLDIKYVGIWNEVVHNSTYVKELHQALLRHHLQTKLVCCDEYVGEGKGQWAIADEIKTDPELNAAVDVIGVHYPLDKDKVTTTYSALMSGKPLWASEDQPNGGSGPYLSRAWDPGGGILANLYNRKYLEGAMTKTEIWSPITSYYDNLAAPNSGLMYANTPWSGHYEVQSTIWVTAHTTQFAQPAWQYMDASSGYLPEKGTYVSLRSPDEKDWSVVLETVGASHPQKVDFVVRAPLPTAAVSIWETNGARSFEKVAELQPSGGSFSYTFEPDAIYSLTTTTGQGKGSAQPPPSAPFPLPYKEDFETVELKRAPKYLSDQDGAFEVHPCLGRPGRCLEQVITMKPTAWGPEPDPFTMAGDAKWKDYCVSADLLFLTDSPASMSGRIDSADVFQDSKARFPSGYMLRLKPDGSWELLSSVFKKPVQTLASGSTKLDRKQWHRLQMCFAGNNIGVRLDGSILTTVQDGTHAEGMFALGSEWDRIEFDNLEVLPK
ncbi:MAG TPA: hypothetical protein VE178_20485 [Silvibacterium sp.]|nr:hypothetical protein [Silvibacterium sp.]